jgi:hypothetical protein
MKRSDKEIKAGEGKIRNTGNTLLGYPDFTS